MAKHSTHSSELDRLFRAARRDIPSAREQLRVQDAVLAALQSGQVPPAELVEPAIGKASISGTLTAKVLGVLSVVALVLVGAPRLRQVTVVPSSPSANDAHEMALEAAAPGAISAAPTSSASVPDVRGAPPLIAPPLTAPTHTTQRSAASSATLNKHSTSSATKAPPGKSAPSEAALIEQAHRELSTNPSAALALTESHRKLYPQGILSQEREVVAIEALARLGKSRAAKQRVDGFRNAQPNSIHEPRIRGVLSDAGVDTRP